MILAEHCLEILSSASKVHFSGSISWLFLLEPRDSNFLNYIPQQVLI